MQSSPLGGIVGGGETSTTASNSVQGHYMSDRIEKTIQKFSKKQIIKNNSPFLNTKSRNFNQSNSASKIYCSTFKGISNKNASSPYMNGGIYHTQLQLSHQKDSFSSDNEQSSSIIRNFQDMSTDKKQPRQVNLADLSFESMNPINNSFTEGMKSSHYQHQPPQQQNSQLINQINIKAQFQKSTKAPRILDSQHSQQPSSFQHQQDYSLLNNNFEDSFSSAQAVSNFVISHPNAHWWSQQMYPLAPGTASMQNHQGFFDQQQPMSHYQMPQYPQSVQASPFQQSKSRDGGYRNIPMRDLSSISDQSPSKPLDESNQDFQNHPFKGPKLHLFKKGNSRRIKTSSATRNLQPIYPLDSSKLALNFNSIVAGASHAQSPILDHEIIYQNRQTTQNQQQFDADQENQYHTLTANNKSPNQYSSIQAPGRKHLNPFSTNHMNIGGTIDVYANEDQSSYGNYTTGNNLNRNLQLIKVNNRPNTTSLDQLESQTSPKRQQFNIGKVNTNPLDPKACFQGLSKVELQEEINGFKHSFYNEKNTPKNNKLNSSGLVSNNPDSARQIDKMKEQILSNSEAIKHIFVLNVQGNQAQLHQQSTQESKAMTPCFIHTPNMTNKWGTFKPDQVDPVPEEQNEAKQQKLFVKDKSIKGMVQAKKPQTSHQSKNQSISSAQQQQPPQVRVKFLPKNNQDSIIKIGPEDIYLASGSKSSKVGGTIPALNKPQTSSSVRINQSRNTGALTSANTQQQPFSSNFTSQYQSSMSQERPKKEILKIKMTNFKMQQQQQQQRVMLSSKIDQQANANQTPKVIKETMDEDPDM